MALNLKRNDTRNAIVAHLINRKGNPADLTDATSIEFIMTKNKRIIVNRQADVMDAVSGKVCFAFLAGELTEIGFMKAEFKVTYLDGSEEPFPNTGYISICIEEPQEGGA